jgi:hypothetical protein
MDFLFNAKDFTPEKRIVSMKRIRILSLTVFTLLAAMVVPAQSRAQGADPTTQLQTLFQSILDEQAAATTNGATLKMDGPIEVEPAGSYYAVTLPPLTLEYQDGQKIQIGMISINASAADKPGNWKMTLALPTPITGFDASGKETMRISLGEQKVAGIWNEALKNFSKLDANYQNVRIDFPANNGFVSLKQALIRYDFTKAADGTWSGPAYFEAVDSAWNLPTLSSEGTAEKLSFNSTIDQFSPELVNTGNGLIFSPALLSNTSLYKALNKLDIKIEANNFHSKFAPPAIKPAEYTLASGALSLQLDKVLSGTMDARLGIDFTEFKANGATSDLGSLLPQNGSINLMNKNIPAGTLADAFAGAGQDAVAVPMLIMKIPALLSQAGTFVETKNSYISNNDYRIDLGATMRADITAVNNATGQGRLAITGLDRLLANLQVITSKNGKYREPARMLEQLKTVGKVETGKNNDFVHVFDVLLDPKGALTVNGKNLSEVIGKPASPPAVPAPAVQQTE